MPWSSSRRRKLSSSAGRRPGRAGSNLSCARAHSREPDMQIDRRTFSRLVALAMAGAAVPVQSQRKLNIQVGHTGITWPWGNPPGPGPMRLADPAAIEQIVKDIASVGFYGIELFGWQIDGLEAHGGLGPLLDKYKLPLMSSYGGPNLTDPAQRRASI